MADFIGNIPYSDPAGIMSYIRNPKYGSAWVRKEYTRTRDIMQKRITRLKEAGYYAPRPAALKAIKSDRDLAYALSEMYNFLYSKHGSLTDIRNTEKQFIQTLREMGLDEFKGKKSKKELKDLGQEYRAFLIYVHSHAKRKLPGSEALLRRYQRMKRGHTEDMPKYMKELYKSFKESQNVYR